jgi:hypothetical protein
MNDTVDMSPANEKAGHASPLLTELGFLFAVLLGLLLYGMEQVARSSDGDESCTCGH